MVSILLNLLTLLGIMLVSGIIITAGFTILFVVVYLIYAAIQAIKNNGGKQ